MTTKDLIELFETYFKSAQYFDNYDTSLIDDIKPFDLSILSTKLQELDTYINKVLLLPVYKNEVTDYIFRLMRNSFASVKTILETNKPYNDVLFLSDETLNNLLLSFGFDILALPKTSKQIILSNLIRAYKYKGTVHALEDMIKAVFTGKFSLKEIRLRSDGHMPYFYYQKINPETNKIETVTFGYNSLTDRYWFIDKYSIPPCDVMSPFVIIEKEFKASEFLSRILIFKKRVYDDYQVLTSNPSSYNTTKKLTSESFPDPFNYLELWYMIRYLWSLIQGYVGLDSNIQEWFYNNTSANEDALLVEYNSYMFIRDLKSFDSITTTLVSVNTLDKSVYTLPIAKINGNELYRYVDTNRTNASIAGYHNKVVIYGGLKSGTITDEMTLLEFKDGQFNVSTYSTNVKLKDALMFIQDNVVVIFGGYDDTNTFNTNLYTIDLDSKRVDTYENFLNDFGLLDYTQVNRIAYDHYNNILMHFIRDDTLSVTKLYGQTTVSSAPYHIVDIPLMNIDSISINLNGDYLVCDNTNKLIVYVNIKNKVYHTLLMPNELATNPYIIFPTGDTFTILCKIGSDIVRYTIDKSSYVLLSHAVNKYGLDDTWIKPNMKTMLITEEYALVYKNDTEVDVIVFLPYAKFPKHIKIDQVAHGISGYCEYNEPDTSMRKYRQTKLSERQSKFISTNPLPSFATLNDLEMFLNQLVPNNVKVMKDQDDKEYLLLELLSLVSRTIGGDFTTILSGYINKFVSQIVQKFKPIQTRIKNTTILVSNPDIYGDWITTDESLTFRKLKHIHQPVNVKELIDIKPRPTGKENIQMNDKVEFGFMLPYTEYIIGLTKEQQFVSTSVTIT